MKKNIIRISNFKHGMSGTPTYITWCNMKSRCNRKELPRFHRHGGRGITYDPAWDKFENFYKDMGDRPEGKTLDRIDNDGNYYKDNCRWATPKEQANNKTRRNKKSANCSSKYRGVYFHKTSNRWRARGKYLNKGGRKFLGHFKTEEEAAKAVKDFECSN